MKRIRFSKGSCAWLAFLLANVFLVAYSFSEPDLPKDDAGDVGKIYGDRKLTKIKVDSKPEEQPAARRQISNFGFTEIIFAVRQPGRDGHFYANFSYDCPRPSNPKYGEGGRLCALNLTSGTVRVLLDDAKGGVRDPQVHYDGKTILFSYRKGGQPFYHLYEIQADGTGLRQITDGLYDDIFPCWLPDGGIAFSSTRSKRWVPCMTSRVATLFRCQPDGSGLKALSADIEQNLTPCVLPDGRILYTRWEYTDRAQTVFHHLWTMNPDGTGQMVYYGNGNEFSGANRCLLSDAKPIPGTRQVVCTFGPGHGLLERAGYMTVVDAGRGPDDLTQMRRVSSTPVWRGPYPLSSDCFLVANNTELAVMDGAGKHQQLYNLPPEDQAKGLWVGEPLPLAPRPREPIIASQLPSGKSTGVVYLQNAYLGRNMDGVRPGEIKKLLILEDLPRPVSFGDMGRAPVGRDFTIKRVLGTVPVEADGSAYFELPAMRCLFFEELDEHDMSVKRMQSFMVLQPGETVSCIGCHEPRVVAPAVKPAGTALRRAPSRIEPIADVPDVFDFPRDIQPILDRNCLACHDYVKTPSGGPASGGIILSGDHGMIYSTSYSMLSSTKGLCGGSAPYGNAKPHSLGSSSSKLLRMIDGSHHDAKLTSHEAEMLRLWIETSALYCGTYAALDSYEASPYGRKNPAVWDARCAKCHQNVREMPDYWFNLSRPEKSLILLATLAPQAGGCGLCRAMTDKGKPGTEPVTVFKDITDPDYQALLAPITAAGQKLTSIKRFDMPGFRPNQGYIREMKLDGILPADTPDTAVLDPYKLDHDYWRSFWPVSQSSP